MDKPPAVVTEHAGEMTTEIDPLLPLLVEIMQRLLLSITGPITWTVGDTWVVYDSGNWTVGADEPATKDQVREVLARAGERAVTWSCSPTGL